MKKTKAKKTSAATTRFENARHRENFQLNYARVPAIELMAHLMKKHQLTQELAAHELQMVAAHIFELSIPNPRSRSDAGALRAAITDKTHPLRSSF